MAQKGIREYSGKAIISKFWNDYFSDNIHYSFQSVLVSNADELSNCAKVHPWLTKEALVIKPDMLFGNRGKNNLVYYKNKKAGDVKLTQAEDWIKTKTDSVTTLLKGATGTLDSFIVEPFLPHDAKEEYYIAATTESDYDCLQISAFGGIDVESQWEKVANIHIPLNASDSEIIELLEVHLPKEITQKDVFLSFASGFYALFRDMHFSYLEINPVVIRDNTVFILDLVAKCDDTACFLMRDHWAGIDFPQPFGIAPLSDAESHINRLDSKSGASLKLTILNPKGRVWLLVAGGGASVVYSDTIANRWGINELANYGEYSGNPSTDETYEYAKTLFELMTQEKDPLNKPKILLIGGAIANFTDVAKTFDGIIQAMREKQAALRDVQTKIYVRRGGPNYKAGLQNIQKAAIACGLDICVHGSETHMTDIIRMSHEVYA